MSKYAYITILLTLSGGINAQQFVLDKNAIIAKSNAAPTIDGSLIAGEWDDATLIDDLYQVSPDEYAPPSEKTEFFLKFDKDFLYLAVKAYERNPSNIVANTSRQGGELRGDDRVSIVLDPYNSKRAGYKFSLNPNGVRWEAIFVNVTEISDNWSAIWDGKTTYTDYGWSAEFSIPFKSLSFSESSDVWGINLVRDIVRNSETIGWVSRNRSDDVSVSGAISGFSNMDQGMGLDVVPSVSFTNVREYNPQIDDQNVEPSVDMFYKFTPSLNGALTINTDFSATEVDDQQTNIGQFNRFFPEKRDFFLREFDIFDFGGIGQDFDNSSFPKPEANNARPFFSRNIGLSPSGEVVSLIAGAKISGKIDSYNVGALVVQQDEFVPSDPLDETIDTSTLFVGRVAADVLGESSIGAIFTQGSPQSNLDNSLIGVDFRYRKSASPLGRIDANIWYQQTDTEGLRGNDSALGLYFSLPNNTGWRGMAQYERIEENYNPALGFVSRTNVDMIRGVLGYTLFLNNHAWLESIYSGVEGRRWEYLDDGALQTSFYRWRPAIFETSAGDSLSINYNQFAEGVWEDGRQPLGNVGIVLPYGEHNWDRYGILLETSKARKLNLKFQLFDGDYYTGTRLSRTIELGWRITPKFQISGEYEYWDADLPEGSFNLRQANARMEWAFNSTLSWVNVVQYNNLDATMGVNSRLHWTPRAGQNVYFVINHNFNELDDDNFVSASNEITLKASYTFRF